MMEKETKLSRFELFGLALIVVILLYFPYQMIAEHRADSKAMSYYKVK